MALIGHQDITGGLSWAYMDNTDREIVIITSLTYQQTENKGGGQFRGR